VQNGDSMASSKRRKNKKRHARERKRRSSGRERRDGSTGPASPAALPFGTRLRAPPSELDQIKVFIGESELGRPQTTIGDLRDLARELPFEATMLQLARLNLHLASILRDPRRQWALAQAFYEGDDKLLADYARVLASQGDAFVFSPQALALLMRVLIDDAHEEALRDLTDSEQRALQRAVLGAHSALESDLDAMEWPTRDHVLAYELQAATYFHQSPPLEEMARHDQLLRLAADDMRLVGSRTRVPVREWLATYGLSADEQWVLGYGLAAMTSAFADSPKPRALAEHVDDLLVKMRLPDASRDLPVIAGNRGEFQTQFELLEGGDASVAWEVRPFKRWPFLRLGGGDLLLLSRAWLLSWLGEGFHYRAMTHAQQMTPPQTLRYTTYVGEVVERYALDLAEDTFSAPQQVFGEQPYRSRDGDAFTSDVAVSSGEDLVLFEVHARRVAATAAVSGDAVAATTEVSRLLVGKADQLGVCVRALLDERAALPSVDIAAVRRIWPVVVSMGHVMQTTHLWEYIRSAIDPEKVRPLRDARLQPLQILTIENYEKLMGLVCAGNDLVSMLARRSSGPYRERDFAVWLRSDPEAPSGQPRHPDLELRWKRMAESVTAGVDTSLGLRPGDSGASAPP
jgi:hypothetical protein